MLSMAAMNSALTRATRDTTSTTDTANSTTSTSQNSSLSANSLSNSFMQLLVTQLQNQDPLQPVDDQTFLTQLAQFSSLQQETEMNQNLSTMATAGQSAQLTSYLGKQVTATNPSTSTPVTGTVQAIDYVNGSPMLSLGTTQIDPTWVTEVKMP